jgi:hypothetical protein
MPYKFDTTVSEKGVITQPFAPHLFNKRVHVTIEPETSGEPKPFPSEMFLGKIKWGEDALQYQKRVRKEWE